MKLPRLVLYTTDHCTMCDQALDLLLSMPELAGVALTVQDVIVDPALVERYGERLPVLARGSLQDASASELDWPFRAEDVRAWLAASGTANRQPD